MDTGWNDGHNKAYIKLLSVNNKKSPITGKVENDCRLKSGAVKRKAVTVKSGDDLLDKSGGRDIKVALNKDVFLNPKFKQLWDRIKYKTTFRVDFDVDALAATCAKEIKSNLQVGKARFIYRKVRTEIDRGGVHAEKIQKTASVYNTSKHLVIMLYLQSQMDLTSFQDAMSNQSQSKSKYQFHIYSNKSGF